MILGNTELYKTQFKPITKPISEDRSLFIESLNILMENNRTINDILKRAHINLLITESSERDNVYLREFSFSNMIKSIIDFFIDAIKTIFGKFKTLFHKIVYSDNTIDRYADKLKNMTGEFTVSFPRYIYTCFDEDTPSINLKSTFDNDYNRLQEKLKNIADLKIKTERCERMRSLEADVKAEVNPAYYDTLRQNTIKKTYMISSHDFASELFNVFRDGGKETTSKITPTEVTNTLNRFTNYKVLLKQVESAKSDTINAAKEIKRKIESISLQKTNQYYIPYDTEEEVLFNKILQTKSNQVNEACNIFTMAFSAKLDAIKEAAIQDKKVLFDAIRYINMGGV